MAHDVFVSYSAQDKPSADAVCAVLEQRGIRVWIAPRDVMPGAEWAESIIDAIEGARVMVLVFSGHANRSRPVRAEVERAVNRGVAILPLRIEEVQPARALEFFISTPHWLDAFSPPLERHLQRLADAVIALLARPPEADQPSPAAVAAVGDRPVTAPPVAAVVAVPPVGAIGFAPEPPATVPPAAPKTSGPAVVAGAESGRRGGLKPAVALKAHATQADKPSVASAGDRAGIAPPVAGVAAAPLASGDGFAPELPAAPVPKASGPAAGAGAESGRREESKRAVVLKTGVALVLLLAGLVLMLQLPRGPIWRPSEFNDKGLAAYQQNDEGLAAYQQNDKGLVAYQQNDYAEAMIWYRMAADRNFAAAQNNVGLLYERGHGVPQDYTEAMRWYRMAADQNFAAAQCNIGLLYLNGQGVPHDFAQARSWMKKAAANGDDFAKQWLATH